MSLNDLRDVKQSIKFLSFSPDIKIIPTEWKLIFKIKNKPTACLCRKFVNNGYFYVNKHTNKIVCLGNDCREILNFEGGCDEARGCFARRNPSYLTAYCDTSIFNDDTYDRYMKQAVFNQYLILVNEAVGFDELTLLYFDMTEFISNNSMDFLLPIFKKLKSKYEECRSRGNPQRPKALSIQIREQIQNKYLNYEHSKYKQMTYKNNSCIA
jgi:hypothetical protein